METAILFGYGSLRSDIPGYSSVPRNFKSLGVGCVSGELHYIQNRFGKWAGLVLGSVGQVRGEVYEIPANAIGGLDYREMVAEVTAQPCYIREQVKVLMDDGHIFQATAYTVKYDSNLDCKLVEKIPSGDWKQFYEEVLKPRWNQEVLQQRQQDEEYLREEYGHH